MSRPGRSDWLQGLPSSASARGKASTGYRSSRDKLRLPGVLHHAAHQVANPGPDCMILPSVWAPSCRNITMLLRCVVGMPALRHLKTHTIQGRRGPTALRTDGGVKEADCRALKACLFALYGKQAGAAAVAAATDGTHGTRRLLR